MKTIVCAVVIISLVSLASGEEEASKKDGPVKEAINRMDQAAIKGMERYNQGVEQLGQRFDKFVNPDPHVPGQNNLVVSAAKGLGRLMQNVTVETALGRTASESVNRMRSGAIKHSDDSSTDSSSSSNSTPASGDSSTTPDSKEASSTPASKEVSSTSAPPATTQSS